MFFTIKLVRIYYALQHMLIGHVKVYDAIDLHHTVFRYFDNNSTKIDFYTHE